MKFIAQAPFTRKIASMLAVTALLAISRFPAFGGENKTQGQTVTMARQAIQANYNRSGVGYNHKNIQAALADCRADYTYTNIHGKIDDLDHIRKGMAHVFSEVRSCRRQMKIVTITLKGMQARVRVKTDVMASIGPEHTPLSHTVEEQKLVEDIWEKSSDGWVEIRSRALSEQNMMDGQLVHLTPPSPPRSERR